MADVLKFLAGWCLASLLVAWGWSRFMRTQRSMQEDDELVDAWIRERMVPHG